MKAGGVLLLAAVLVGCRSMVPLAELPAGQRSRLIVELATNQPPVVEFSTARGRNAQQAGSYGGLIGSVFAAGVGSKDESDGKRQFERVREQTGRFEPGLILEAVRERLRAAGITLAEDHAARLLIVEVKAVGLEESQRGFLAPCVRVSLRLAGDEPAREWKSFTHSLGTRPRRLEDYVARPELYRQDFKEVAEDIARQLIIGPIRF